MPEVYADPRRRATVGGERQRSDKEICLHAREQRQQQHVQRRRVESGSAEVGVGNLPAPAGTAVVELAQIVEAAGSGEEETAAGISRAKALAAAGGVLVAV